MDARDLLHGLTAARLAELCKVSQTTASRWRRLRRVPEIHSRLLRILLAGELGSLAPAWSGFTLRDGQLITPEGWTISPGEICAIPFRIQQLRALEIELAQRQQWDRFRRVG
jgi:transcriptional regulator with XRE-family HTH domain